MERNYFSEEEVNELRKNKFVKTISSKSISYTDEFKTLFIEESKKGKGLLEYLLKVDLIHIF